MFDLSCRGVRAAISGAAFAGGADRCADRAKSLTVTTVSADSFTCVDVVLPKPSRPLLLDPPVLLPDFVIVWSMRVLSSCTASQHCERKNRHVRWTSLLYMFVYLANTCMHKCTNLACHTQTSHPHIYPGIHVRVDDIKSSLARRGESMTNGHGTYMSIHARINTPLVSMHTIVTTLPSSFSECVPVWMVAG